MKKVKMTASGRVQGVGFRWGVLSLAVEIGDITGRVWNNDDGTVTILAQSDYPEKISQFIHDIRKGPTPFSNVSYLDVTMANFEDYKDFKVQHPY
ncbi:acylphosphatase [Streptococcus merionis]|uniref:acylphosphatase n=1 Tax=Streptococcus merionis TaxID=400065 RepID=UPI0026F1C98C|nr:acylphosphatase [Streptococcus merionis]